MDSTTNSASDLRNRLLAVLARPGADPTADRACLVAVQDRLAVLEWPDEGKGLVVLGYDDELGAAIDRVLRAHESGLLFVVVVGGGTEVAALLKEADRMAPNRDHLGMYHLNDEARLLRVAGRRLAPLESAAAHLAGARPLDPPEAVALIERCRQERAEAAAFARGLSKRFPHVTMSIVAVCFLVFALLNGSGRAAQPILERLTDDSRAVFAGQLWRVFTYAFLHANFVHILVNMFALYSLGGFLEALVGWRRFLAVYCASAVAGGVASAVAGAIRVAAGGLPSQTVGASGAIWGLMGATLGLVLSRKRVLPRLVARGLRQRLLVVLVINIALSFVPGIDLYAHFGGGLIGFLMTRGGQRAVPC